MSKEFGVLRPVDHYGYIRVIYYGYIGTQEDKTDVLQLW